jgi:hypothetical protein
MVTSAKGVECRSPEVVMAIETPANTTRIYPPVATIQLPIAELHTKRLATLEPNDFQQCKILQVCQNGIRWFNRGSQEMGCRLVFP